MSTFVWRASALLGAVAVVAVAAWSAPPTPPGAQRFEHARNAYSAPALAVDETGRVLLVGLSHDGIHDRLCAWLETAPDEWGQLVELATAEAALDPVVVAVPGGGFVVSWSALVDGDWEVFLAEGDGARFGAPERITEHAGADTEPTLAVAPDGTVWLAWQRVEGARTNIVAYSRSPGAGWVRGMVTDEETSDIGPSLAVDADGTAWIAWSSWRHGTYADGNYEVLVQQVLDPATLQRVTDSFAADLAPSLLACGEGLALVWTESYFTTRRNGVLATVGYDRWTDKVYRVAWSLDGEFGASTEVRLTDNAKRGVTVSNRAFPVAAPDGEHVWLLYGELDSDNSAEFVARATVVGPGSAAEPQTLNRTVQGPAKNLGVAWRGERLLFAQVVDRIEAGAVLYPFIEVATVTARPDPETRPLLPRSSTPRKPLVEGLLAGGPRRGARTTREHAGKRLTAWLGNLHLHSDLSRDARGFEGSPSMNFQVVYDLAELDFAGLSDHAESLLPGDWWEVRKVSDQWNRPGVFVTLPGYEWTSWSFGHRNVYFPDTQEADVGAPYAAVGPRGQRTPEDLWQHLGERRALTIPHHPSHALSKPTDWSFHNDRFQRLIEIFQVRGNYEYDGAPYQKRETQAEFVDGHSLRAALAAGHRLGIIASPDHGGGMGLAGVWSEELTRESIFEALYERRTFGTTGAKMDLFLEVAGAPQGSEVEWTGGSVQVAATVNGTAAGLELVLVRDGVELETWTTTEATLTVEWTDDDAGSEPRYYYLRATQGDGHIGWTSPVWIAGSGR